MNSPKPSGEIPNISDYQLEYWERMCAFNTAELVRCIELADGITIKGAKERIDYLWEWRQNLAWNHPRDITFAERQAAFRVF
jgi:hypothetical protein